MKHEWRKHEKEIYLLSKNPQIIELKPCQYFTITGEGNPNYDSFGALTEALYAVSYAIKMSYKSNHVPKGYYDYTVYPLEGIWDLIDPEKGPLDKDNLKYEIMIRQPDFVTADEAAYFKELAYTKKKNPHIEDLQFKTLDEGLNLQALHLGAYDEEPATFSMLEAYAAENGYKRISKTHKEIYLSDPRKVASDKLKTVLRFRIEKR